MASPSGQVIFGSTAVSEGCEGKYIPAQLQDILPDLIDKALQGFEGRYFRALEEQTQTLLASLRACSNVMGEHSSSGAGPTAHDAPPHGSSARPPTPEQNNLANDIDSECRSASAFAAETDCSPTSLAQRSLGEGSFGLPVSAREADEQGAEQDVAATAKGPVEWQWLASSGCWKPYDAASIARIEAAYRRGESKVLLRSGKSGKVPMELFFVDLLQRDPESRRERQIRRRGAPLSCWESARRHSQAYWRALILGKAPYESCREYKARRTDAKRSIRRHASDDSLEASSTYSKSLAAMSQLRSELRSKSHESRASSLQKLSSSLVESYGFNFTSFLIVMLQYWWIWHSMDLNFGIPLYHRDAMSLVWESLFLVYFTFEFAARILALQHRWMWHRRSWLLLDFVCALSTWVEVLIFPFISKISGTQVWEAVGGDALRVIRLLKVFRLSESFGRSQELNTVVKGTISGMKSTGYILVLLGMAVFFFAILLRVYSDHHVLHDYFGTVDDAMLTLLSRGLFLDGVRQLVEAFIEARMIAPMLIFCCFMYITFFGLLSMLIGAFCNVAEETATKEHDEKKLRELNRELEDIAWCYMEDKDEEEQKITHKNFKLFIRNPDVQKKFHDCQVDAAGVENIVTAWFKTRKAQEIEFVELLAMIAHMREGRPSFTSDIAVFQGFVMHSFDRLERSMASARPVGRGPPSPRTERCSKAS